MRYIDKFETDPRDNFDRLKEALDEGFMNSFLQEAAVRMIPVSSKKHIIFLPFISLQTLLIQSLRQPCPTVQS